MTRTTAAKFSAYGDSYDEILEIIEEKICEFFDVSLEELHSKFNYEFQIFESTDMDSDSSYECLAIVRKRDV